MTIHKHSIFKVAFIFIFLVASLLMHDIAAPSQTALAAADSCTPPATTYGTDTMTISIPAAATYTIWTRIQAPTSTSNSILLNIDNGTSCYNVGGNAAMPTGQWTWVNYNDGVSSNVINVSLSQGTHTFLLTGTEAGVSVDRIEALTDGTCIPSGSGTGSGDNCAPPNSAPTISMTAPANGATVNGTTNVTATATANGSGATISNVQFKLDGSNLGGLDTTSPYSASWNTTSASNGTHTLTAVATDSVGLTTTATSITVTVNNGGADTTPPVTSISSGPPSSGTSTSATFSFAGTDNITAANLLTFQCQLDGGAYGSCTSPKAYTGLSLGAHTFNVRAIDAANNTDPTPATQTWTVTAALVGDLDGDSHVTGHDLSILLSHYGTNYAPAEFDGTPVVEAHDLSLLLSNYGK